MFFSDVVDINNLNSMNRVIGNTTPAPDAYTNVAPHVSFFYRFSPLQEFILTL